MGESSTLKGAKRIAGRRPTRALNPSKKKTRKKNPTTNRRPSTKKFKTKRSTVHVKPRKNPKKGKRKNPLRKGYSQTTVSANIAQLRREGYSEAQAAAIALRSARAAWRKKSPRGGFPKHLETRAERSGQAKRKTTRKRNPKRTAKAKKKNPRKWSPPKGSTPRAVFMRKQHRSGASKKQAEARWRFKKQAQKRRPKARRR